jgi:hypothetical protein
MARSSGLACRNRVMANVRSRERTKYERSELPK